MTVRKKKVTTPQMCPLQTSWFVYGAATIAVAMVFFMCFSCGPVDDTQAEPTVTTVVMDGNCSEQVGDLNAQLAAANAKADKLQQEVEGLRFKFRSCRGSTTEDQKPSADSEEVPE